MSAADFLLSPEVQKLLKIVLAKPATPFPADALAKATKLTVEEVERTQEHLLKSGILSRCKPSGDAPDAVCANTSFIFYRELRGIALKSFAAAEPIRAMLRSKFKDSVLRAFVLGEEPDGTVELLVVHGDTMPGERDMAAACQKLSAAIGRHLKVQVIASRRYAALTADDALGAKLAAAFEVIAQGETKARAPVEREGLFQSARKKLAALARS